MRIHAHAPEPPPTTPATRHGTARQALLSGDFRDRHYNSASLLLGLGVFTSILGGFNTYFRAGKLFPGPHLFAGAGITVLWAVAAAIRVEVRIE